MTETTSPPAIELQGLTKAYPARAGAGEVLALDDVSLTVPRGEFLSLLGPSGCGKSTLLHVIGGLNPARGTVRVHGRAVTGPGLDRGIVFQDYALLPWRTVLENVKLGLELKGVPARERDGIAAEHVQLVGLSGFERRLPGELSGGMRQRVAIARALAFDPEVLLLDEPFAALDAQTREDLQEELLRVWRRTGKTVVFVTHSLEEAVFLSQRVAVMTARPGRIKAVVDVAVPEREEGADVRSSPAFAATRHALWELLSDEVRRARALTGSPAPPVRTGAPAKLLSALRRAFSGSAP